MLFDAVHLASSNDVAALGHLVGRHLLTLVWLGLNTLAILLLLVLTFVLTLLQILRLGW